MTVVQTRSGAVRAVASEGVRAWRGIPYARAPIGRWRWAAPVPEQPWSGIRDGGEWGDRAPQQAPAQAMPAGPAPTDDDRPTSEDCLYVNVSAPEHASAGDRLPVRVWIHGGGFHLGSGAGFIGDGAHVVRSGTVLVTFNYRLGALGFLNLGDLLGPEFADAANCALLDQIAALRWVRENIAAFGGDPGNVTVQGVSAGGKSVINLMASPAAEGLFRRGISHSGGDHTGSAEDTAALARRFVDLLDLPGGDPGRIREVPVEEITAAQYALGEGLRATWIWRPTVGGAVLPHCPTRALAAGRAAGIPLIAGVTDNECGTYVTNDPSALDHADAVLRDTFPGRHREAAEAYATQYPDRDPAGRMRAFMSDERYGAPTLRLLDAQSRHAPVWHFRFRAPMPGAPERDWYTHGSDMPYAFGLVPFADPEAAAVAEGMREAFGAFGQGTPPGSEHFPDWPAYEPTRRAALLMGTPSRVVREAGNPVHERLWADHDWTPGTWWPLRDPVGGAAVDAPVSGR
ncbi:carboxylesterase/lipase family protein [Streptomyces fractus]|uniref:carboxylesterase/lipase family protein n=1 Tax=Streptomyces fractus TaxID=641806 RepID=UPI003CEF3EA6